MSALQQVEQADRTVSDEKLDDININSSTIPNRPTGLDASVEEEFMKAAEAAVAEVLVLDCFPQHPQSGDGQDVRMSVSARPSQITTHPDGEMVLEAVIEKRARPRGVQKLLLSHFIGYPWESRKMQLCASTKILKYYDPKGTLKGSVEVLGTKCQKVEASDADGRENAFVIIDDEDDEVLLLAATSDAQRDNWVKMLNILGKIADNDCLTAT